MPIGAKVVAARMLMKADGAKNVIEVSKRPSAVNARLRQSAAAKLASEGYVRQVGDGGVGWRNKVRESRKIVDGWDLDKVEAYVNSKPNVTQDEKIERAAAYRKMKSGL